MKPTWQTADGAVQLFLGDCLTILPHLGRVDAVVTDPPYGVGYDLGNNSDEPENQPNILAALEACQSATLLAFGTLDKYRLETWSWRWSFVWHKRMTRACPAWGIARHYELVHWYRRGDDGLQPQKTMSDVLEANPPIFRINPETVAHPSQKPIRLIEQLINAFDPETVLDPFAGSFTTAIACIRTGRRCIAIEKESKYFQIGVKRIEDELYRAPLFEPPQVQKNLIGEDAA